MPAAPSTPADRSSSASSAAAVSARAMSVQSAAAGSRSIGGVGAGGCGGGGGAAGAFNDNDSGASAAGSLSVGAARGAAGAGTVARGARSSTPRAQNAAVPPKHRPELLKQRRARDVGGAGFGGAPFQDGGPHRLGAGPPFVLHQIGGHQLVAGLEVLLGALHGAHDTGGDVAESPRGRGRGGRPMQRRGFGFDAREQPPHAHEPVGLGFAGGIERLLGGVETRDRLHQRRRSARPRHDRARVELGELPIDGPGKPAPRLPRRRRAARRDRSEGCAGASEESHSRHRITGNRGAGPPADQKSGQMIRERRRDDRKRVRHDQQSGERDERAGHHVEAPRVRRPCRGHAARR